MTRTLSLCALIAALASPAAAQTAVPLLEPKPVFVPGMYETEARNSKWKDTPVKSRTCIASADFDAFRDEIEAQSLMARPRLTRGLQASRLN